MNAKDLAREHLLDALRHARLAARTARRLPADEAGLKVRQKYFKSAIHDLRMLLFMVEGDDHPVSIDLRVHTFETECTK